MLAQFKSAFFPALGVFVATLIGVFAAFAEPKTAALTIQGRASVIDGDTVDIHGQRIRLHGIDAFESGQTCADAAGALYRCGKDSAFALDALVSNQIVTCIETDRDRWGRIVALCGTQGAQDLGRAMVRQGWALAYRKYSTLYVPDEIAARAAVQGAWVGAFEAPDLWRKSRRTTRAAPGA